MGRKPLLQRVLGARKGARTLALGLAWLAGACSSYAPGIPLPDIVDEINATLQPNVLVLQPGDVLGVTYSDSDDPVSERTRVGPDGRAHFLHVGELEVAGMSVEELEDVLSRYLEESLIDPEFRLVVAETSRRDVVFLGDTQTRTLTTLPDLSLDLIEALGRLGAPRDTFSLLEHLVLIRWMPDEGVRRHWVIDAREEYWTHPTRLFLQPYDLVYIPRHPIRIVTDWSREISRIFPVPRLYSL